MTSEASNGQILPTYDNTGDIALKNQQTLRKLVGTLGILLPVLVYLFLQATDNFDPVLPSISHYYFTRSASIFEVIVSLLAVFLMIYKGEKFIDFALSTIAGLSALLMLIFPTNNLKDFLGGKYNSVAVTFFRQSDFRPKLHYSCASTFLLSLAIMSLFLFTKTSKGKPESITKGKKTRNAIYITCGIIMLSALLTAFLGFLNIIDESFYNSHNMTFWMEVIAVEAFGFSWMIKGGLAFTDKV